MKPVVDGKAKSFEITREATDKYNEWLQGRLQRSVWTECMNYYRGDRQQGKIIATFPGPVALFWWLSRRPVWKRYHAVDADAWAMDKLELEYRQMGLLGGVVVCVAYVLWSMITV
jgi:hypothetical protein